MQNSFLAGKKAHSLAHARVLSSRAPGVLLDPLQIYSRRSDNTLFCQNPQEVTFEELVDRHSWKDSAPKTPTVSLVSLISLFQANGCGGFGSQTAADPPRQPPKTPEKQTAGTVTASHKMFTVQAPSRSLSMPALQREAGWAKEKLLGDL